MVERLTSNASLICSSFQLGPLSLSSALSRIRACCNLRADSFPVEIICSKSLRSSFVSFTIYFFMGASLWIGCSLFHQDILSHSHLSISQWQPTRRQTDKKRKTIDLWLDWKEGHWAII